MKDADGRVLVKDFYKGVEALSETEKKALAAMPGVDEQLKQELGLARTEKVGARLEEAIMMPSLNIRGLASAAVGRGSRNVIPAEATASLDIRVVKGVDYRVAVDRVVEHVRAQGYYVTDRDPDEAMRRQYPRIAKVMRGGGDNAVRTSMDLEVSQRVLRAVETARGPVIAVPTLGGTLPLQVFDEILHRPVIVVPIANHDNNQHSHNENIRLQNLWDGIETMAALLTM
jgi:acetylornithine deacetylase/succinyl-diaminopimelate desuccinylase-like protein